MSAIPVLFLALSSDPWWTLTGVNNSHLFTVAISPYYVSIIGTGFSSNSTGTGLLGTLARGIAFLAFLGLILPGLRPFAWWRKTASYAGITSLTALYLIFLIMYSIARASFLTTYNVVIPYLGTVRLPANILGSDLRYYPTPLITANFSLLFFLGLVSIGIFSTGTMSQYVRSRIIALAHGIAGGVRGIYLSPPYHHVWISSADADLNPLYSDPERTTDDELLISFEKLYKTVDPGGSLSIILPAWSTSVVDRFQKLLPYVGFKVELSSIVYRTPGVPESELRFRKPLNGVTTTESPLIQYGPGHSLNAESPLIEKAAEKDDEPPFVELTSKLDSMQPRATRIERAMVRTAVRLITEQQAPVPYRDLLNRVYMDLIDRKVDFESSRQIENTLLGHTGKELELVEEPDATGTRWIRKWWLGERKVLLENESGPNWFLRLISQVKDKIPKGARKRTTSRRRSRYHPKRRIEEE